MKQGRLYLQYEGLNPSGSFKDNGMTATFTHARMVGARRAACASTGNTSASVALYAACSGLLKAVTFIGKGKIALGKLVQTLDSGALTLEIDGDFDDAMKRVIEVSGEEGIYLMNSVNPFRLEGQKAIMFRVLEALSWEPPDWIVVPGGNLGNSSAFGKAFLELSELGLVRRVPRLAVVNSTGASTLYRLVNERGLRWNAGSTDDGLINSYYEELDRTGERADTLASAIEINCPVNLKKCLRALDVMNGVVCQVTDEEILDAKAKIGASSIGCEPASAASVAGVKRLVEEGTIACSERVVCILTGHQLKDQNVTITYHAAPESEMREKLGPYGVNQAAFRNAPVAVPNDLDAIKKAIAANSSS
jgi:threonine synthase